MINLATTNGLNVSNAEPTKICQANLGVEKSDFSTAECGLKVQQPPNTRRFPSSLVVTSRCSSHKSSKKAQFMVVTIVLIGLAFFTIFLLTRTVDRSAVVMFEPQSTHFDNLRNAIIQRNSAGISETEFCAHMNDTLRAVQEKLECGVQNTFGAQTNYSIKYTTPHFSFAGFLS